MRKILVIVNDASTILQFRTELILKLVSLGYKVFLTVPFSNRNNELIDLGCELLDIDLTRHGINPFKELLLLKNLKRIVVDTKPNIVLSFTIKPNIYGGIICESLKIPYIANITGLGDSINTKSLRRNIVLILYALSMKKANCVFFQNEQNMNFFISKKITNWKNSILLPGSGVNLEKNYFEDYPEDRNNVIFLTAGRLSKQKGILELIEAIKQIKQLYNYVRFVFIGSIEDNVKNDINNCISNGLVEYHQYKNDIHDFIKNCNALIQPSHHEGMSNVLLEASSCGRPVIASEIPGCIETFDKNISGFGFEVANSKSLFYEIKRFIDLPYEKKKEMGLNARKKMVKEFDRSIVVDKYIEKIIEIIE